MILLEFCVSTSRWRGSQKSKSAEELVLLDRDTGDGEGESEGQELMERRSEAWLAVTDGGWINTTDRTVSLESRQFGFRNVLPQIKPNKSFKENRNGENSSK